MILDIILCVLCLVVLIIGYKVGFLKRFIKIANVLGGGIIALLLASPFANLLGSMGLQKSISSNILSNIESTDAYLVFTNAADKEAAVSKFIESLGFPNFLADIIAGGVSNSIDAAEVATSIADSITKVILLVISFILLLILATLLMWILKLIINLLRTNFVIRLADGILGVAFSFILFIVGTYLVLLLLSVGLQIPAIDNAIGGFIRDQLHLGTNEFGITKYLYENNIIGNILKLFF